MTPLPKILSIARAGNPARAWSLFHSDGWDERGDDPKALTLKARLLKDRAKLASGAECVRLYGEAADVYVAAAALDTKSYPLINAATLALLGGKEKQSRELATEVLDLLTAHPDDAETDYWLDATRAEALLLLGKEAEARAALKNAIAEAPEAWEDHAATIGQFALIIAEQGGDAEWLDRYRPPCSLHFSGIIGLDDSDPKIMRDIAAMVAREKPGFGYGALAAGADIMIAEALHAAGARLHIILPYPVERFRELSVAPYGDHWLSRFDALVAVAEEVRGLAEMPAEDEWPLGVAIDLGNQVAMGQALRNAAILQSKAKALTIIGEGEEACDQSAAWQNGGHELHLLEAKRVSARQRGFDGAEPSRQLKAILWAENGDCSLLGDFVARDGGHYLIADSLSSACSIGLDVLNQSDEEARVSLLLDVVNSSDPSPNILEQVRDIALASDRGTLLMDHKTAMALILANPGCNVQEIGELKVAYGPVKLWSAW